MTPHPLHLHDRKGTHCWHECSGNWCWGEGRPGPGVGRPSQPLGRKLERCLLSSDFVQSGCQGGKKGVGAQCGGGQLGQYWYVLWAVYVCPSSAALTFQQHGYKRASRNKSYSKQIGETCGLNREKNSQREVCCVPFSLWKRGRGWGLAELPCPCLQQGWKQDLMKVCRSIWWEGIPKKRNGEGITTECSGKLSKIWDGGRD